jgi:hypothetical protein
MTGAHAAACATAEEVDVWPFLLISYITAVNGTTFYRGIVDTAVYRDTVIPR